MDDYALVLNAGSSSLQLMIARHTGRLLGLSPAGA
jgi:hypothetical protein